MGVASKKDNTQRGVNMIADEAYCGAAIFRGAVELLAQGKLDDARQEIVKIISINREDQSAQELLTIIESLSQGKHLIIRQADFGLLYSTEADQESLTRLNAIFSRYYSVVAGFIPNKEQPFLLIEVSMRFAPIARTEVIGRPVAAKIGICQEHIRDDHVCHEIVHAIYYNVNRFLCEGLAVYLQYQLVTDCHWPYEGNNVGEIISKNQIALPHLMDLVVETNNRLSLFSPAKLQTEESLAAYISSGAFVEFLINCFGRECFWGFYRALNNGNLVLLKEINDKVREHFNMDVYQLEARWRESLGVSPTEGIELEEVVKQLEYAEISLDFCLLKLLRDKLQECLLQAHDYQLKYLLGRTLFALVQAAEADEREGDLCVNYLEQAIGLLEEALNEWRDHADSHRVLGECFAKLIKYRGRINSAICFSRAEQELKLASKYDPTNGRAYLGSGRLKMFTPALFGGSVEEARKLFVRALELMENKSEPYAWLGYSYKKDGLIEEARRYFLEALRVDPSNKLAKSKLDEMATPQS